MKSYWINYIGNIFPTVSKIPSNTKNTNKPEINWTEISQKPRMNTLGKNSMIIRTIPKKCGVSSTNLLKYQIKKETQYKGFMAPYHGHAPYTTPPDSIYNLSKLVSKGQIEMFAPTTLHTSFQTILMSFEWNIFNSVFNKVQKWISCKLAISGQNSYILLIWIWKFSRWPSLFLEL